MGIKFGVVFHINLRHAVFVCMDYWPHRDIIHSKERCSKYRAM